jgi:hypothetical protein
MIDKDKLNQAFSMMRKQGLVARQNFSCCCGCAGSKLTTLIVAMSDKKRAKVNGVCFYHRQDNACLMDGDDLWLSYGPVESTEYGQIGLETAQVGHLVALCLDQAGLTYEWDGNPSSRILVTSNNF